MLVGKPHNEVSNPQCSRRFCGLYHGLSGAGRIPERRWYARHHFDTPPASSCRLIPIIDPASFGTSTNSSNSSIAVLDLADTSNDEPLKLIFNIWPDSANWEGIDNFRHQHIGDLSGDELYKWVKESLHDVCPAGICNAQSRFKLNIPYNARNGAVPTNARLRLWIYNWHQPKSLRPQAPAITSALIELIAQAYKQQVDNWYARTRNCYKFKERNTNKEWNFCNVANCMRINIPALHNMEFAVRLDFGEHGGKNMDGKFDCQGVLGATEGVLWGLKPEFKKAFGREVMYEKKCEIDPGYDVE